MPLVKGENQVDFSWINTQIDPNTIVFRVIAPVGDAPADVKVLSGELTPHHQLEADRVRREGGRPVLVPVRDVLEFATIQGARTVGLDHKVERCRSASAPTSFSSTSTTFLSSPRPTGVVRAARSARSTPPRARPRRRSPTPRPRGVPSSLAGRGRCGLSLSEAGGG